MDDGKCREANFYFAKEKNLSLLFSNRWTRSALWAVTFDLWSALNDEESF